MSWFLIILNLAGGEPAFIEMPDQTTCEVAAEATNEATVMSISRPRAQAWCIPAGEWPMGE